MISAKWDSDVTSLAPSSPFRSPKPPAYYVQSPSRNSHDGDKSSSLQATPVYNNSPVESPSHPSFGHHSRNSSGSRFSGIFRSSSGRKGSRKHRNDKGWPECNVIMEEETYDEIEDKALSRRLQAMIALFSFVVLFTVFCLIIWGASKPYKAEIAVKSLEVNNFYAGEGSDSTGVPTKIITLNGTVKMSVYNPATIFGIHVTSPSVNLMYSEIPVATGQMTKYYQPRKSSRTVNVILEGDKVPLYGAGSNFTLPSTGGKVPFELKFEVWSRGYVVGKLVRTTHRRKISCPVTVDSTVTKPILLKNNDCTYE